MKDCTCNWRDLWTINGDSSLGNMTLLLLKKKNNLPSVDQSPVCNQTLSLYHLCMTSLYFHSRPVAEEVVLHQFPLTQSQIVSALSS